MNNNILILILCVACFIIGGLVFNNCGSGKEITKETSTTDTIWKVDTIKIQKPAITITAKAKKIYIYDTTVKTVAYIASLDTIIKHDTINAKFDTFTGIMNFDIKYGLLEQPHKTPFITNTNIKYVQEKRPWYETLGIAILGASVGYVIGNNIKK